ncbi:hypothetical protein Scep_008634 [Stephania cephalantha]|uniref:Protein SCARECROW-like n=1 Tax=Stephania cephalantha TaxID=152367 RepID=A0AAP0KCC0_9MAGN
MKGELELVHGTLDLIQPHEQWDEYCTAAAPPVIGSENYDHLVTSTQEYWMDNIGEEEDSRDAAAHTSALSLDENNIPPVVAAATIGHGKQLLPSIMSCNYELSLITHLLECAVAISVDNLGEAHRMLLQLSQMASPYGASCAERVVAYFAMAMSSRVMNSWLGICSPLINYKSIHYAFHIFNNVSPFVKFAHFTSNQAILESIHQTDKVIHIVDLDIMQGLQWPALFHILATRLEGPPQVRMTGVGNCMDLLLETGRQLSNFAKRLGMSFEFHPIANNKKSGDFNIDDQYSAIQARRGEAVAVHWLRHSLYDATGPDWKTLRLIQRLSPRVITLVEQDIAHEGTFLDRFVRSLHYYSTVFDSLGAALSFDDPCRHRVEHGLFNREINNILAIGGPVRSGEEKLVSNWRRELGRGHGGIVQVPMSRNCMAQAQLILNMLPPTHGYSLVQEGGTLRLGWKHTSLYTASAWTCHSFN